MKEPLCGFYGGGYVLDLWKYLGSLTPVKPQSVDRQMLLTLDRAKLTVSSLCPELSEVAASCGFISTAQ